MSICTIPIKSILFPSIERQHPFEFRVARWHILWFFKIHDIWSHVSEHLTRQGGPGALTEQGQSMSEIKEDPM